MLTEERLSKIVSIVEHSGSATIAQLMDALDASESTIRRDLAALHDEARLIKVRGGAIANTHNFGTQDDVVELRKERNTPQKLKIAQSAGALVTDDDFVFIDAGTTTELMIPYITSRKATFVTNALSHALKLAAMGLSVYIPGGEFKNTTEAIVGEEAVISLQKYNFTKGFFGVNGITVEQGYTTPEIREALIKGAAMKRCFESFILADASKFAEVSAVSFGEFDDAVVLTDNIPESFRGFLNIREPSTVRECEA